jgi:predicted DNA-binding ribbon-helix-helix protein
MIRKYSITLHGHRTSFSLEEAFYRELADIAAADDRPVARLIAEVDDQRNADDNLSSALRLFVLRTLKARLSQA